MLRETTRNEDEKLPGSRDEELQSRPSSACWKRKENVAWEEGFATGVAGFLQSMNSEVCLPHTSSWTREDF